MSFTIKAPGFYVQRNGDKAEVFAERDGRWWGRMVNLIDREFFAASWNSRGAFSKSEATEMWGDIIGPWPKFFVGDKVRVKSSDLYATVTDKPPMFSWCDYVVQYGTGEVLHTRESDLEPDTRPTPPAGFQLMPADYVAKRDVDRGCTGGGWWWVVDDSAGMTAECLDKKFPGDAKHFIASPIPAPAQPEWVATNDMRWLNCGINTKAAVLLREPDSMRLPHLLQQKFTRGTETEWRAVEVQP